MMWSSGYAAKRNTLPFPNWCGFQIPDIFQTSGFYALSVGVGQQGRRGLGRRGRAALFDGSQLNEWSAG